uniref:Putative serine proteinase inhibitor n=1 Tax=Rhipicephalus microplus TaxID=6941 RepID=A0A6M2D5N8_RHIMP
MDKCAFLLILILSNAIPLLAWPPSWLPNWLKKATGWSTRTVKPHNKTAAGHTHRRNHTVYKAVCDNRLSEICLYPLLCLCPKYDAYGYVRNEGDRWYYNNITNQCVKRMAVADGCNDFETIDQCERHCFNATERSKALWSPEQLQAIFAKQY